VGLMLAGADCNININAPTPEAPTKVTPDTTQNTPVIQDTQDARKLPDGWLIYNDQQAGVSYGYQKDFAVTVKQKAPAGVVTNVIATRFAIPQRFITGTNLGADSAIYVYKDCVLADMGKVESKQVEKNGQKFTEYTKYDSAAGNMYNSTLISTNPAVGCINVLLFMHSVNPANLAGQVVTQFDHATLINIAYGMAGSVQQLK
jgi:hypothetical protein